MTSTALAETPTGSPVALDSVVRAVGSDRRGRLIRLGGLIWLGGFVWAGQIKQVPPFNGFPVDFTLASAALSLLLSVALVVRRRSLELTATAFKSWVLLLIIALSGSFFRLGTEYGAEKELTLYQLTLPLALAGAILVSSRKDYITLVMSSGVWAVFLSLSVVLTGVQDQTGRLNASTGATISFSRAAAMVITAALAWALTARGRRLVSLMPVLAVILMLEIYVVVSIGSRGPAQAVIIAMLMMLALQAVRLRIKIGLRMLVVLAAGALALALLWSRTPEFSRQRLLGIITGDAGARSGGGRDLFYQWTFENAPYTPFGNGWGSWPQRSGFRGYTYVHNIVLELWFEAGLLALVAFLVVLYWVTRDQFRRVRSDRFVATLIIGITYSWVGAALVSGDFNDNRSLLIMMMAAAAVPLSKPGADGPGESGTDTSPPMPEEIDIGPRARLVEADDWTLLWEVPKS